MRICPFRCTKFYSTCQSLPNEPIRAHKRALFNWFDCVVYTNNWHLQWTWNKEKSERLERIQTQSVPSTVRESAIHCLSTPPIKSNRLLSLLQLRWRKLFRAPKKRCSHFYSGTGCAVRQFTGTHSYSWVERGNAKVPYPEYKRESLVGEDSNTDPSQFKIWCNYNKATGIN